MENEALYLGIIFEPLIFLAILFTREKNSKIDYIKNVGFIFIIAQICTLFTFPIYGNIFGIFPMILTATVLGTLMRSK
jgi:hypothetical protein